MKIKAFIKNDIQKLKEELTSRSSITEVTTLLSTRQKIVFIIVLLLWIPVCATVMLKNTKVGIIPQRIKLDINTITPVVTEATVKLETISVPKGTIKANPFLPYRNLDGADLDVPEYTIVDPVEVVNSSSDGARLMDTIVSGILYDKFSPSAILNIEGNDYLVKKGDVVNNYEVLNILKDSVTVKLGSNTYKAGIGEILTEGTLKQNTVSNLDKKFGGEKNNELY